MLRVIAIALCCGLASASEAGAQGTCPKNQITGAALDPDPANPELPRITVQLEKGVRPSEQGNARWSLYDVDANAGVGLVNVTSSDYGSPGQLPSAAANAVYLKTATGVFAHHVLALSVSGLHTIGCTDVEDEAQPALGPFKVDAGAGGPASPLLSPSTNRSDSELYVAPTIDGTAGTKPAYTLDLKFQPRFSLVAPLVGGHSGYRPGINFIPGIDFKASSNPKEDGSSVTIQAPFEFLALHPVAALARAFPALIVRAGPALEADKTFAVRNLILSAVANVRLGGLSHGAIGVAAVPEFGVETGKRLVGPEGIPDASVLRWLVGGQLTFTVMPPAAKKPLLSVLLVYTHRDLTHDEPRFASAGQSTTLQSTDSRAREHVSLTIAYTVSPLIDLSAAYEYGELPPLFTLVNSKYTFGVTFKGAFTTKPGAK